MGGIFAVYAFSFVVGFIVFICEVIYNSFLPFNPNEAACGKSKQQLEMENEDENNNNDDNIREEEDLIPEPKNER